MCSFRTVHITNDADNLYISRTSALFSCTSCNLISKFRHVSGRREHAFLIDSQLLCRQPRDRRLSPLTGRNQTLYIQDCCWRGCFAQPDLDGRIPCRRGISFPLLCPAASPPTGWLWTDHHVSGMAQKNRGRSAILTDHEGNVGHSTAAALSQDFYCNIYAVHRFHCRLCSVGNFVEKM